MASLPAAASSGRGGDQDRNQKKRPAQRSIRHFSAVSRQRQATMLSLLTIWCAMYVPSDLNTLMDAMLTTVSMWLRNPSKRLCGLISKALLTLECLHLWSFYTIEIIYHCLSSLYVYVLAIRKTINESSTSFSHLYYWQERWTVQQELNTNAWRRKFQEVQLEPLTEDTIVWKWTADAHTVRAQFLGVVKRDHAKLIWQAHTETNTSCSSRSRNSETRKTT